MLRYKVLIITLFLTLMTLVVSAQNVSLDVKTPGQVVQGNNFTVTFRVVNADARISRAPELKGCVLRYGPGISTFISQEATNRGITTTQITDYTFTYYAEKAGTVTVQPISLQIDGKKYSTPKRTITILPPDRSAQQQGAGSGPVAQSSSVSPNDLIVTVSLSKQHIYEQEAVIATIKVYTKHNIRSFRATTLPSFDGFLSEELPVPNQEAQIEHFRGENYYTAILKRCLLYPQKAGKLTINSGRYDVTLETYEIISNGFAYTRRPVQQNITTVSNSLNVTVDALPEPRPADFSGAVGTFKASASLEPSLLRTNEAATYTYTITGTGNIKYLSAPEIDFGSGVEEYKPETESDASFSGGNMTGSFTTTYTIVPQQVGSMEIPARNFVYFDPSSKKYVTIPIAAISAKIIKGSDAVAQPASTTSAIDKIDDILHIKNLSGQALTHEPERLLFSWLYISCYFIVIIALVTAAIVYRRQIKLNSDVVNRRTARARRVAVKRLKVARAEMNAHRNDSFYSALASALWGYMSDKLQIPASALTRDNIAEKLAESNVDRTVIDRAIGILDECEMARFTPAHSDSEVSTLYENAVNVINDLETSKKQTVK